MLECKKLAVFGNIVYVSQMHLNHPEMAFEMNLAWFCAVFFEHGAICIYFLFFYMLIFTTSIFALLYLQLKRVAEKQSKTTTTTKHNLMKDTIRSL